jgi:hypothetical protein
VQDRLALETGKMKELENGMEHANVDIVIQKENQGSKSIVP